MPTPASRTPVRIARGTYANLLGSIADLGEGEICFANDRSAVYIKSGGSLIGSSGTFISAGNTTAEVIDTGSDGRFVVTTEGSERLRIDPSGRLGIGTSSPDSSLTITKDAAVGINIRSADANFSSLLFGCDTVSGFNFITSSTSGSGTLRPISFRMGASEAFRVDTSGRVGIGATGPSNKLHVLAPPSASSFDGIALDNGTRAALGLYVTGSAYSYGSVGANQSWLYCNSGDLNITSDDTGVIKFSGDLALERARIDSSGRLLVGTSSARDKFFNTTYSPVLQIEGTTYSASMSSIVANGAVEPYLILGRTRSGSVGGTIVVNSGDACGVVSFQGSDGTELVEAASITALVDGTPGTNDMPGRLVFSTTADGASSPTERLRISNTGAIGLSGANFGTSGQVLTSQGSTAAPQWATLSTGSMVLLGSVTANNSASVAFTSGINSTYDVYVIIGVDIAPSTNSVQLRSTISTNGGSSYLTSGYDYLQDNISETGAYAQSFLSLSPSWAIGSNTSYSGGLTLVLYRPSSNRFKTMSSTFSYTNDGGRPYMADLFCGNNTTTAYNAIQFYMSSGNIASGTFRLYGIKNS